MTKVGKVMKTVAGTALRAAAAGNGGRDGEDDRRNSG